jgi:hypothetical protein
MGEFLNNRDHLYSWVPVDRVKKWVQELVKYYGSQHKVCLALEDRFESKKAISWEKYIIRLKGENKKFANSIHAEPIWLLLSEVNPEAAGQFSEQSHFIQPLWCITGLKDGRAAHWYYLTAGKAKRKEFELRANGTLLEISYTIGPWETLETIPEDKIDQNSMLKNPNRKSRATEGGRKRQLANLRKGNDHLRAVN